MRLSKLQKFIIITVYFNKPTLKPPTDFYNFYTAAELKKDKKIILDTIHKSLDNLVEKNLLIAYGRKTAQKWYIDKVKLTGSGKKMARLFIMEKQLKLI